ncbi:flavodoxin domain-containing protein [Nocardia sp. NPDC127526]|uniref:flavodoxin domain-containing protein n=1 Tax=Nocardia sp. NPDC127526 TaxID=3345393 RepID=UPI00362E7461
MKGRILVAYATRYGSTREVAERVADTLRAAGLEVDCRAMEDVDAIDDYRGFVLGAPFYYGHWPRPARRFLTRFCTTLGHRDVAVFATGQVDVRQPMSEVSAQIEALTARYDWLHPIAVGMFGGRWDPALLTGWHRVLRRLPASPMRVLPASDLRSWPDIEKWAGTVATKLKSRAAQPNTPTPEPGRVSRSGASLSMIGEYLADQQRARRKG